MKILTGESRRNVGTSEEVVSYLVLARKYRPQNFDEVIGQEHITRSLKNAILNQRIAHSYLFTGSRGIGKTSTARILAKALNCIKGPLPNPCQECVLCREITQGISMDVLEIDGASNRRIDEIRNLRENVKFAPSKARFKIYIIDEVHMLTPEAFNALLKTLEEPPLHIKFIFATTQPEKIPLTILSRCQRFDFRRITDRELVGQLKKISQQEKIDIEQNALFAIARFAQGSMRDGESVLDQLISFCEGKIIAKEVISLLGIVSEECLFNFGQAIIEKDVEKGLTIINALLKEGKDLEQFVKGLTQYFRNLIMAKEDLPNLIELSKEEEKRIIEQSSAFSLPELFYAFSLLTHTQQIMRGSLDKRICLEFLFLKMAKRQSFVSIEEILEKIKTLETSSEPAVSTPACAEASVGRLNPQPEGEDCPLGELKEIWSECLAAVQGERMSLATFLQQGEIISVQGNKIEIGFSPDFSFYCQNLQRRENKKIIEKLISEKLNKEVKIIFTLLVPACAREGARVLEKVKDKVSDKENSPSLPSSVKKAMEIFEGRICPTPRH